MAQSAGDLRLEGIAMLGIIWGTGMAGLAIPGNSRRETVQTPYGAPSSALVFGTLGGRDVVFLARHGEASAIAPHEVNYRANLWALHARNARDVIAIASVGGITPGFPPGALAVPDQIIDYTHGRASTFHVQDGHSVKHVDFTLPYCEALRQSLLRAAVDAGEAVVARGTYAAMQGPRLETAAEINRLERDGADIVGMTGMPEAALARELGLCYAAIAVVVNHAAGRGDSEHAIPLDKIQTVLDEAMGRVRRIIGKLCES